MRCLTFLELDCCLLFCLLTLARKLHAVWFVSGALLGIEAAIHANKPDKLAYIVLKLFMSRFAASLIVLRHFY